MRRMGKMTLQELPEAALGLWLLWRLIKEVAMTIGAGRIKKRHTRARSRQGKRQGGYGSERGFQ